ncbi:hypothetical protein KC669_02005 [Candidatus Dojkabacteria bacterium]|uniref:Uncharacterized protein n=1 Tax=Candidatus Dojkabacteria bacterium TaxID=2099670 RepID=A0A955RL81_9BACT|nr:hypothetical protein [Candidatus Dojkabacteria bacterium]
MFTSLINADSGLNAETPSDRLFYGDLRNAIIQHTPNLYDRPSVQEVADFFNSHGVEDYEELPVLNQLDLTLAYLSQFPDSDSREAIVRNNFMGMYIVNALVAFKDISASADAEDSTMSDILKQMLENYGKPVVFQNITERSIRRYGQSLKKVNSVFQILRIGQEGYGIRLKDFQSWVKDVRKSRFRLGEL